MKILYAVQATGNGHISRALEILPNLKTYGKVDIFLSGSNSHLQGLQPALKSRGISLHYTARGGFFRGWCLAMRHQPQTIYNFTIEQKLSVSCCRCRFTNHLQRIPQNIP